MLEMVKKFPAQMLEAIEIGENAIIKPVNNEANHVYVTGMGGSGIGADFVAKFIQDECRLPYLVNKTYFAPSYINEKSIVIASSYSGNTEESLSNVNQCIEQGARVICIASGGKLIELAKEKALDYILVPNNWASPRASLGYSLIAQLYILYKLGLISSKFKAELKASVELISNETQVIQEKARHLANSLAHKTVVIYSTDRIEPVSVRFRQQINENAKRLCWHHVIPEMNHNELVGWRENKSDIAVIFLRNSDDYIRNQHRIELTKEVVSNYCNASIELYSKGSSLIEKCIYLVHLLDYTSVYLSEINKVDAVEVKVIDYLKSELAKES